MKYEKTKKDQIREKNDLENDPICQFLKHRDSLQFQPGDILIKLYKGVEDKWEVEQVSDATTIPRKYMYAFENELGVGYLKTFKVSGQLNEGVTSLTEYNYDQIKFILDPEYADHILLNEGEEYRPTSGYKDKRKFREKALNNNKKLLIPRDDASIKAWVETLKVGDEFHMGYDIPQLVCTKYKVKSINSKSLLEFQSWQRDNYMKSLGLLISDKLKEFKLEAIKHKWGPGRLDTFTPLDFFNKCIMTKEPFPLSEGK